MAAAEPIVRVAGVHKVFSRGSEQIDVLNDLSLEVAEGEALALMGPSGSGKTTLLNLIAGLDRPTQGEVWVGGQLISALSEAQLARWRTRHIGFIFQFYHLLPVLSAYENVELPLLLLPLSAAQRKQQVLTALDLVGLSNRLSHRPGQLSGGQQQRVGIARAIVTDPTLIVADEPTGDLDSRSAEEILDLLGELRRGLNKTILLVTHDPRAAARAQRILHLDKGQLVSNAPTFETDTLGMVGGGSGMKLFLLAVKNLRRNLVRTGLTSVATMVLVFVITLIWSILWFLNAVTEEKSKDFKAIISERWQIPSQMPYAYAPDLAEGAYDPSKPDAVKPLDYMTWGFYGGTLDPTNRTRENSLFLFVMEPEKVASMMDELDQLEPGSAARRQLDEGIQKMRENKRGIVVGTETLKQLNKRVGDRIVVTSINYKDIDLEFDVVGAFPDGRYNKSAVMNRTYLNDALDDYKRKKGTAHPMADKSLALVWLRVNDPEAYRQVAEQITTSSKFSSPAVKVETASNGIASFLDAYKDLLWGMRFLLVPAIVVTMCLVIANAISISIRERRTEIAVMKVLGFRPNQLLLMVLGEALLVGTLSGLLSAGLTYYYVDFVKGGLNFQIAFFGKFFIPDAALWWGPLLGGGTAFLGSFFPAWSACRVKVTEVFSKVG